MRNDLMAVGLQVTRKRRIAASATRFEAGEPIYSKGTYTTGEASVNTWVLAAEDFPVLATHTFGGIAIKNALPYPTGTLIAQTAVCACPVPHAGLLRGKAYAKTSIDTEAELLGVLNDTALVDYNATGGIDGGEAYTIATPTDSGAITAADTSGFAIIDGSVAKGTLDCEVYATVYRLDQDITA